MKVSPSFAVGLVAAALCAAPAFSADCGTAQFSPSVTERFPNIRDACFDVVEKSGQQYAVIKADLVRTDSSALYVRVKHPDGTRAETRRIPVKPGFQVVVNGKPVSAQDLSVGQELTTYVKVSDPVMVMVLDVAVVETVELEPVAAAPAPAASPPPPMPRTASVVPLFGLGGAALVALGLALALGRRLRRDQGPMAGRP